MTPPNPPRGMTAQQLAEHVQATVHAAMGRVTGVGAQQYDEGSGQRFERMGIAELVEWTDEELLDLITYPVMLRIHLGWICAALEELKRRVDDQQS